MSQFVVGVTGGIGSGKTTVTDLFAAKGIKVVDADLIAREVVSLGSPGLAQIHQRFGDSALLPNGTLNRAWLRQHVFQHPADKNYLDRLLHPLIREQMKAQTQAADSAYCILSIPLLVENKLQNMVNRVLVIDVDETIQLARAVGRDKPSTEQQQSTEATIKSIMQNQCSRQQRLAVADDVVNNSNEIANLQSQVDHLHAQYVALAKTHQ
jgi:dephospho-CoA kinase